MGRGKLALELISKEKSRKITFEKRKKGLIKKAKEFSILCGVDTCMIIYGTPAISDRPEEPEIWPPDAQEVQRIIQRYRNEGIDCRMKRSVGLPDFFVNRKKKLDLELAKARSAVWEAKYPVSDDLIAGFSEEQLRSLLMALGNRLESAKKRLAALKEKEAAAPWTTTNNIINTTPVLAAGFDLDPSNFRQNALGHSFYLHGTTAGLCYDYEPMAIDMKLPVPYEYEPPRYTPNMPLLPNPNPPPVFELPHQLSTGFCSSSSSNSNSILHHQSKLARHEADGLVQSGGNGIEQVSHLDAHQLLRGSNFHHHNHYHHYTSLNYQVQNQNCFSSSGTGHPEYSAVGGLPGIHEQQETCGELGSVNVAYFSEPTSSGTYYDGPEMKQLLPVPAPGRVHHHQFQFGMMNVKTDQSPSPVQMQVSHPAPFNHQFHDTN